MFSRMLAIVGIVAKSHLFAFSSTERVRKPIHIPSLFPRIHSIIPTCMDT